MSNNPFLKSRDTKNDNSRFGFLETSNNNTKTNKTNRKHIEYDSSQNSFTQHTKFTKDERKVFKKHVDTDNNFKLPVANLLFNDTTKVKHNSNIKNSLDINDIELFPDLVPIKNVLNNQSLAKFTDMINCKSKIESQPTDNILPGWIKLTKVNKKTHVEYGPSTKFTERQKQNENLNYIMTKAIERIEQKNLQHEKTYDAINGEGTFREKFGYEYTYGSEYDTENDTDTDIDEEEHCDEYNAYEYL